MLPDGGPEPLPSQGTSVILIPGRYATESSGEWLARAPFLVPVYDKKVSRPLAQF
jgi:hypothetical protein